MIISSLISSESPSAVEQRSSQSVPMQPMSPRAVGISGFPVSGVGGVEVVKACWLHEGKAADLIRRLKYRRDTAAVTAIADALAAIAPASSDFKLLTWVPCTPQRHRSRGFDPAELIARALARRLCKRAKPLLRRLDDKPQTSRGRQGRLVGPSLALRSKHQRLSGRVLVVDDVCTTGSTLRAAATALRSAGSGEVAAVVATAVRQR